MRSFVFQRSASSAPEVLFPHVLGLTQERFGLLRVNLVSRGHVVTDETRMIDLDLHQVTNMHIVRRIVSVDLLRAEMHTSLDCVLMACVCAGNRGSALGLRDHC